MTHDSVLAVLLAAIKEAGQAIVAMQKTDFSVSRKANQSLVTQADLLANDILKGHLLGAFPGDGWLSEESVDDPTRLHCQRVWIVDPIDGTKEFAAGLPEYALSVALIEAGEPILAAVYNPATDELFYAIAGGGAWYGEERLDCSKYTQSELIFLASRSECQRGEWHKLSVNHNVKQLGSIAYKLALVAKGTGQVTFSLGPKNEWDIAAGVLLVQEANGIVCDKAEQPFIFNQPDTLVNGIIAAPPQFFASVIAAIQS